MAHKNYYYKQELKNKVIESLKNFDPRFQERERVILDCPECNEEEGFFYIPKS